MSVFHSATNPRMGKSESLGLMLFAVGLMILLGSVNNNFAATGISGNPTLTCDQTLGFCYNTANTGCQSVACSFGAISFLSQTSPFTQLLAGNIFGVFNQITTGSASIGHGPFDSVGTNTYILGNCVVYVTDNRANIGLTVFQIASCTQANPDGSNMTKANANTWANWNPQWTSSTKSIPFFNLVTNATIALSCNWNYQINYTFSGSPYDGWTWYGCGFGHPSPSFPSSEKSNNYWAFLISVPWVQGSLARANGYSCGPGGANGICLHVREAIQLENWETAECSFTAPVSGSGGNFRQNQQWDISPTCDQFSANLVSQTKQTGNGFGAFAPLITFLVGLALFFLGTGIGIQGGGSVLASGANFSLFSNPQGTKMAQAVGGGLVVWSVIYSEFGTWITPTYLPFGLDVVVFFVISGAFFFGLYERF